MCGLVAFCFGSSGSLRGFAALSHAASEYVVLPEASVHLYTWPQAADAVAKNAMAAIIGNTGRKEGLRMDEIILAA